MARCGRGTRSSRSWIAVPALMAPLLAPQVARAQGRPGRGQPGAVDGHPAERAGQGAQPMRESPSVGALITQEQIETYGWLSLNDVLFRQPGFAPAQDYERVTVAARGLFEGWNNNHLLMLVDGVPFNNATNGFAYTWDVLPLFMADKRGGHSRARVGAVRHQRHQRRGGGPHPRPRQRAPAGGAGAAGQRGHADLRGAGGLPPGPGGPGGGLRHQRTDGNEYQSLDGSGRVDAGGRAPALRGQRPSTAATTCSPRSPAGGR